MPISMIYEEVVESVINDAEGLIHGFVAPEYSQNGNYNTWFRTSDVVGATTNYPNGFPMMSMLYAIWTNGIGYTTNLQKDAWGHPFPYSSLTTSPSSEGDTNGFLTIYSGAASDIVLVEQQYTSAWSEVYNRELFDYDAPLRAVYNTAEKPRLLYYPVGDATATSYTVSLSGYTLLPQSYEYAEDSVSGLSLGGAGGVTNVLLNDWWIEITNMTIAGTAITGDVVKVAFREPMTISEQRPSGGAFAFSAISQLYTFLLDEIYEILKDCIYTAEDSWEDEFNTSSNAQGTAWTGSGGNKYVWTGTSTKSWSDAKALADAATAVITTDSSSSARHYTEGDYNAGEWTAKRTQIFSQPILYGPGYNESWLSAARSADHYLRGDAYTGNGAAGDDAVYDDFGTGYADELYFALAESFVETTNVSILGTTYGGGVRVWCEDPDAAGNPTSRGYVLEGRALFKYDGLNGFQYK
jgi:hypothetical protein